MHGANNVNYNIMLYHMVNISIMINTYTTNIEPFDMQVEGRTAL